MGELKADWKKNFPVIDEKAIRKFAESIGDWNPLHHNHEAAVAAGMRGIIAPGVMMLGFVSATIAGEASSVIIVSMDMKFVRPLYAGSSPSVLCEVARQNGRYASIDFTVYNRSELVMKGSCFLKLPLN